ncbi:MAG: oxygen-dependent coproporphyrinogen oxidase [Bacteroidota bacterium]
MSLTKEQIADWFKRLQNEICTGLEAIDGQGKFQEDKWKRHGGGGGQTRTFSGKVIEKGGVNFSAVFGDMPGKITKALGLDQDTFFASGVSIVLHPRNPMAPIIHMNVRYFEMGSGRWWFGGGIDLTPHYIDTDAARKFHIQLKDICDAHHPSYYPEFKAWADDYFYLKHRKETRGVGGIFFDRLSNEESFDKVSRFEFVKAVGQGFVPIYAAAVNPKKDLKFDEKERAWQFLRRGRYVEFNLVWDKGTKFGLDTDGRTESILMSLPPLASWTYDYQALPGSEEENTLNLLKKGIDWINHK